MRIPSDNSENFGLKLSVAARYKGCAYGCSKTGIVVSIPTRGLDMCPRLSVFFCPV
jgi:hypothetical protein